VRNAGLLLIVGCLLTLGAFTGTFVAAESAWRAPVPQVINAFPSPPAVSPAPAPAVPVLLLTTPTPLVVEVQVTVEVPLLRDVPVTVVVPIEVPVTVTPVPVTPLLAGAFQPTPRTASASTGLIVITGNRAPASGQQVPARAASVASSDSQRSAPTPAPATARIAPRPPMTQRAAVTPTSALMQARVPAPAIQATPDPPADGSAAPAVGSTAPRVAVRPASPSRR